MTFGEKLKLARKEARMTQEELASKLCVSRQAVSKWEADKGMPDIENLKVLSKLLNVSIDYLLDDNEDLELTLLREPIDLDKMEIDRRFRLKIANLFTNKTELKSAKKDLMILDKYPDAKVYGLMATQILDKKEKILDEAVLWLTPLPGILDLHYSIKNEDKSFYLVEKEEAQYFIMVSDEFIETRLLVNKITDKKFKIGDFKFTRTSYTIDERYES